MMLVCRTTSVTVLLRHYKHSSRKTQTQLRKAALCFRELCMYEPNTLQKKPSTSSEEAFQFLEEAFQFALAVLDLYTLCCRLFWGSFSNRRTLN